MYFLALVYRPNVLLLDFDLERFFTRLSADKCAFCLLVSEYFHMQV